MNDDKHHLEVKANAQHRLERARDDVRQREASELETLKAIARGVSRADLANLADSIGEKRPLDARVSLRPRPGCRKCHGTGRIGFYDECHALPVRCACVRPLVESR
jgi:hypothetical protein